VTNRRKPQNDEQINMFIQHSWLRAMLFKEGHHTLGKAQNEESDGPFYP
jgi:hypothetical protein